jgi:hypothetical protein
VNGSGPGPLSKPFAQWSPFADGLQLDLVVANVAANLGGGALITGCSPASANGIQIFPGSVPIFKGGALAGAIGISGDGIDQDDMIGFLGLAKASTALGTGFGHAPASKRADTLTPRGIRLRYVNCPFQPFLSSSTQDACTGL